jgi:predicted secreted hydrolase
MPGFSEIPFRTSGHGDFDTEWGAHSGSSEWWYCTGYFTDDSGKMYSYQFTILKLKYLIFRPYVVMMALTDFTGGKHCYYQNITLFSKNMLIGSKGVGFTEAMEIRKEKDCMRLVMRHKDFDLDLTLGYGKGAVWHCDDGVLKMGLDEDRQTTLYYSYTNMPTDGTMTLNGKSTGVCGKSWFDKQGGPYSIMNKKCMWEWFSLRFFDDEEIMLFTFPQNKYQDGTYIRKDGSSERLTDYSVTPLDFACPDGKIKYSCRWSINLPGLKEERYTIEPLLKDQMNIGYYELLAGIYNSDGKQTGLCFAELLPGAYNKKFPITLFMVSKDKRSVISI